MQGPVGVPGADPDEDSAAKQLLSKTAKKNAARKARKAEEAADGRGGDAGGKAAGGTAGSADGGSDEGSSPLQQEVARRLKALRKKARQVEELAEQRTAGSELNADQLSKVSKKAELLADLELLEALAASDPADASAAEPLKKLRALRKKARQVDELRAKAQAGAELNDEQGAKLAAAPALARDIEQLTQILSSVGISAQ